MLLELRSLNELGKPIWFIRVQLLRATLVKQRPFIYLCNQTTNALWIMVQDCRNYTLSDWQIVGHITVAFLLDYYR
jgi:hypothetical protein